MALVDKILMSKSVCWQWRCQNIEVFPADGKITRCHGTSLVELAVGHMCPLYLEILVADGKLLGFYRLLGFDAIKKLGGVHLTKSGEVHFLVETYSDVLQSKSMNLTSALFDQQKEEWTAS